MHRRKGCQALIELTLIVLRVNNVLCVYVCIQRVVAASSNVSPVTLSAMKGVASLPTRPSSCNVLKPPPPYSSCVVPSPAGYGTDSTAALSGYTRTSSVGEDDTKSRRRSRVCSRSPGSAPSTMAAKTRRYKRPSSGAEHARRQQQQLLQSYVNVAQRQLSMTDCQGWPCTDSYPSGTDYAAAAAACHSAAEVASCRYQSAASVRPPYRHDLLAVVPAIGPGETGPAAERLKQMAAHYQRLAAASDGDSCGGGAPSSTSSFGCYDDRYSYELYDEFAAQCQRFAVQPQYQQQPLYYDASGYSPMVADTHGYLTGTCNGVSQTPASTSHSQFALAEPVALSVSHVTPQFSYNGGLAGNVGYATADGVSRYMSPCAQQTSTSTTTTTAALQVPVSLYSNSVASVSSCQPTLVSTTRQTPVCFTTEPQRSSVDNFLDIYPPSASLTMSTASSTSTTPPLLPSRRASASTSSTLHLASVAAPVSGRSSWTAGDSAGVSASSTWLTGQLDGITTSPDAGVEAASFCDSAAASRGLDSGSAKPVVDAELFSRQSTLGGIELY